MHVRAGTSLVHFAAQNPYPEADWDDAIVSLDIAFNMLTVATTAPRMRRVVFASSNHVMGRCVLDGAS